MLVVLIIHSKVFTLKTKTATQDSSLLTAPLVAMAVLLDLFGIEPSIFFGLLLPLVLFALLRFQKYRGSYEMCELHSYQKVFLDNLGASHGGAGVALQMIVTRAINEPKVKAAIFDDFHCVHCGSVNPADWIKNQKGDKTPYKLQIGSEAKSFLRQPLLVPVEKRGEPPKRQIVEGPRRADVSKAARCCVDWAIKNYGAIKDGKARPE